MGKYSDKNTNMGKYSDKNTNMGKYSEKNINMGKYSDKNTNMGKYSDKNLCQQPFCPPQISHRLPRNQSQSYAFLHYGTQITEIHSVGAL
jgi:hypothetical protein